MIYLPYSEFYASSLRLCDEELEESHDGLTLIVRFRNKKIKFDELEPSEQAVYKMFDGHWDSFFTMGLYYGGECFRRDLVKIRFYQTWQRYWEKERKFRRKINHPSFPPEFHESVRTYLAWLRPDPYLDRFALEEEPFMEPEISWPI